MAAPDHPGEHDHDHEHSELCPLELRVRALETVLTQKGYVDTDALDLLIDTYQTKIGPRNGAQVVARAWCDEEFHMVVCTLCSCYPWPVLGLPPTWYKSAPYRARAVKDPRGVLEDFGVRLPDGVRSRVWDSTAEVRYLVLPQRPAGSEHLSERELAGLVTRDSMIGTGLALTPGGAPTLGTAP